MLIGETNLITISDNMMIPDLKELWKLSFHDEDSYIDFYFEHRYRAENTYVYLDNGIPMGMLTLLPAQIVVTDDSKQPIYYVYAVATHPSMRRQGIAAKLLDYA